MARGVDYGAIYGHTATAATDPRGEIAARRPTLFSHPPGVGDMLDNRLLSATHHYAHGVKAINEARPPPVFFPVTGDPLDLAPF